MIDHPTNTMPTKAVGSKLEINVCEGETEAPVFRVPWGQNGVLPIDKEPLNLAPQTQDH